MLPGGQLGGGPAAGRDALDVAPGSIVWMPRVSPGRRVPAR